MSKTSWLGEPYLRWPVRASAVAVIGPGLVTSLAALPGTLPTEVAALLYVPTVVLAAAVGGPIAGLGAALLSFQAMNYYFSRPLYNFGINNTDLIALTVFMAVAIAMGLVVAATIAGRARVEKKEMEARLLNQLATRLLAGESVEGVLQRFARSLVEMFRLARCEIVTEVTPDPIVASSNGDGSVSGSVFKAPLMAKGRQIGHLQVEADASRADLDRDERDVMRAFAGQMALALEGIRLSDEVRGARLDAEANRLRATLFSSVTHDLRTPLSSITASVTSLLDGAEDFSPTTRTEHLEMIRQEAERLNRLVANLLDMSRMRAGVLVPNKIPVAIEEVIESVLGRLKRSMGDREVKVLLQDDLPEVPMDVVQIDQVLTNLVENAVKFSPPGSPLTISASLQDDAVRVSVDDAGPGIPPEERDRIFEPFERGDGQHGPGTGLGLAIAKAIVVAHGGRVWVEDSDEGGLAVVFELLVN